MTTTDSLTYPGEFEVLRTKADSGWFEGGELTVTNYRLAWKPNRFARFPAFGFDLEAIRTVRVIRSVKTLFFAPTIRIVLKDGAVYEIHKPKDDANRVLSVIEDYRNRERYKPGSLFGDAT
jgi:hypothetical protein